ncbi:MAG: sulfate adenylyltransferase subunit 2 [Bacteroidia bacterium]
MKNNELNYLDQLESESIYILREAVELFKNPVILFSGGKDSILVTHLAKKAFFPGKIPFALLHIDTGHNFKEVISFRNALAKSLNVQLIVSYVQELIDDGRVVEDQGKNSNRNVLQIETLLNAIKSHRIDCAIGGARRDEEKSRAKERVFSHRDKMGKWTPNNQRPEVWNMFNGHYHEGEHFRVFPISNWTELDVWKYLQREGIEVPSLYFAHEREVVKRSGSWFAWSEFMHLNEKIETKKIRFRTLGDITITGGLESEADTMEKVVVEIAGTTQTERSKRDDDKTSDSAMEDRKTQGYF